MPTFIKLLKLYVLINIYKENITWWNHKALFILIRGLGVGNTKQYLRHAPPATEDLRPNNPICTATDPKLQGRRYLLKQNKVLFIWTNKFALHAKVKSGKQFSNNSFSCHEHNNLLIGFR